MLAAPGRWRTWGAPGDLNVDWAPSHRQGPRIEMIVEQIEAAGPFGPSNPAPKLALVDVIPSGVQDRLAETNGR